ncbi:MAG: hypothetical protein MJ245_06290 [Clostridia bacterium]|nr:hypothetical protein [Clostridia bacterium]
MIKKFFNVFGSFIISILLAVISSVGLLVANYYYFLNTSHMFFERVITGGEYQALRGYGLIKETFFSFGPASASSGSHANVSFVYIDVIKASILLFIIFFIIISLIKVIKKKLRIE